jgi:hypothetical protein
MADRTGSGATPFLAFLVGGLLVLVAVVGFAMYGGGFQPATRQVDVNVSMPKPKLPDAPTIPNPTPMPAPVPTPG